VSDNRPSFSELQRIEREDLAPAPWEQLAWWTPSDRGKVVIRNALPVLLEIVSAAMRYRDNMSRTEIDTDRCEAFDRALSKVRQ
jgi:hypothetical protein